MLPPQRLWEVSMDDELFDAIFGALVLMAGFLFIYIGI